MTIFLGVVLVLLAWLLISGIEGKREMAALSPPASTPGTGAVLVIGGTRASGLEVVRLLRARRSLLPGSALLMIGEVSPAGQP